MQITITDLNNYEQENYGFIIDVTPEIYHRLTLVNERRMTVEQTFYTEKDVFWINKATHRERLAYYEWLDIPISFDNIYEDVFYKGNGLIKTKDKL